MADRRREALSPVRATAIGLAWLAVFAFLYTIGEETGAWPRVALGRLRDLDLVVGLLVGAAVLFALLSGKRDPKAES
jgi:hypothetical protein